MTAAFAATLGVVGGAISAFAFGWMRRSETGYLADDHGWIGHTGVVTLPLSAEGTGKVLVVREDREHELLARLAPEPDRREGWTTGYALLLLWSVFPVAFACTVVHAGRRPTSRVAGPVDACVGGGGAPPQP